jgi:hypothetical protein
VSPRGCGHCLARYLLILVDEGQEKFFETGVDSSENLLFPLGSSLLLLLLLRSFCGSTAFVLEKLGCRGVALEFFIATVMKVEIDRYFFLLLLSLVVAVDHQEVFVVLHLFVPQF